MDTRFTYQLPKSCLSAPSSAFRGYKRPLSCSDQPDCRARKERPTANRRTWWQVIRPCKCPCTLSVGPAKIWFGLVPVEWRWFSLRAAHSRKTSQRERLAAGSGRLRIAAAAANTNDKFPLLRSAIKCRCAPLYERFD